MSHLLIMRYHHYKMVLSKHSEHMFTIYKHMVYACSDMVLYMLKIAL
jgi:hypothetical protein